MIRKHETDAAVFVDAAEDLGYEVAFWSTSVVIIPFDEDPGPEAILELKKLSVDHGATSMTHGKDDDVRVKF